MDLNKRYSRQILLSEIGTQGQDKLRSAKLAVVGCGGLGAIAAAYLAGAGLGSLILIDGDTPDISNVHRQVFYTGNEKQPKSTLLKEKLQALNPNIQVQTYPYFLTKENIDELLTGVDLIMECTDDIMCKYLVNDFCALENIPLVYGAIHKYEGYVSFFRNSSDSDVHLRDIFPVPDMDIPTCSEVGVYNIIAGIIGLMQANEALKYFLDLGTLLENKLLTYEALQSRQLVLNLSKSFDKDIDEIYEKNTYQNQPCGHVPEMEISELIKNRNRYILFSVMNKEEHQNIDDNTTWSSAEDMESTIMKNASTEFVIYCRVGRVSKMTVSDLMEKFPSKNFYSLKGGYVGYQKIKNR